MQEKIQHKIQDKVEDEVANQIQKEAKKRASKACACCHIEFYQQFFEIDDKEFAQRLKLSLWPVGSKFCDRIDKNPDLYGPFWIMLTLAVCVTITGNLSLFWATSDIEVSFPQFGINF